MRPDALVPAAAEPTVQVVRGLTPNLHSARTPCSEYDVRGLINHQLFWGPSLEGAAQKELLAPPADGETALDLAGSDGADRLAALLERITTAWSKPEAWEGTTRMGGPTELPAALVGGMVLGELVVHGWDLARATGQDPRWPDHVLERTYALVAETSDYGRAMGVYGPEVTVPETAPTLDRLLGLTGRDPRWSPA